jgi:uncharacterized membrane protein
MIFQPIASPVLLLLLLLAALVFLVEVRLLGYAYRKVGVPPRYVFAVLLLTLLGAHVNVPLYEVPVGRVLPPLEALMAGGGAALPDAVREGTTVVAVNVGGAVIPVLVSIYLFLRAGMPWRMLIGVAAVTAVVHSVARVIPGVGITVPVLLPPIVAAGAALVLARRRAPPLAYVAGSMGALIGADLLNLSRVVDFGAPVVSIGGAGTFDGIFLTGIIAGLLV